MQIEAGSGYGHGVEHDVVHAPWNYWLVLVGAPTELCVSLYKVVTHQKFRYRTSEAVGGSIHGCCTVRKLRGTFL